MLDACSFVWCYDAKEDERITLQILSKTYVKNFEKVVLNGF